MGDPRHQLGIEAERLVAERLAAAGWQVEARRFRCAEGELDLVCLDPSGHLVGVEVRARRSGRAGRAVETVDRRHVGRLRLALARYAALRGSHTKGVRIDLVTIDRIEGAWHLVRYPAIDCG